LELGKEFGELMAVAKDETLAYTVLVYRYLKESYEAEERELRLIYRKVEKFVAERCGQLGVANVLAAPTTKA
jgi:hypothetical protein